MYPQYKNKKLFRKINKKGEDQNKHKGNLGFISDCVENLYSK
jgi:hypothetical protein